MKRPAHTMTESFLPFCLAPVTGCDRACLVLQALASRTLVRHILSHATRAFPEWSCVRHQLSLLNTLHLQVLSLRGLPVPPARRSELTLCDTLLHFTCCHAREHLPLLVIIPSRTGTDGSVNHIQRFQYQLPSESRLPIHPWNNPLMRTGITIFTHNTLSIC